MVWTRGIEGRVFPFTSPAGAKEDNSVLESLYSIGGGKSKRC